MESSAAACIAHSPPIYRNERSLDEQDSASVTLSDTGFTGAIHPIRGLRIEVWADTSIYTG